MIMYGRKKPKFVKGVDLKIQQPEEKAQVGKVSNFEVQVTSDTNYNLDYVVFELVNERTDKRAPLDRVTSRSRYLYRYNVDQEITAGSDCTHSFPIRIPVHKEPSRNDKFICIKWQLALRTYMKKESDEKSHVCVECEAVETEVV